jgi:hypothetical protein
MTVAKSGRTTGLTCAAVTAVSVDVVVDYFTDCAETTHSMTKTFTNQIAVAGTNFSDAGDSGALVVDVSERRACRACSLPAARTRTASSTP